MPQGLYERTAADVDHAEEAEIRNLERGAPRQQGNVEDMDAGRRDAASHHADAAGEQGGGGSEQGGVEQAAEGEQGGLDEELEESDDGMIDEEEPPPEIPCFPSNRQQELATAAENITTNMKNHPGVQKTYSTYWRLYDSWHKDRFGRAALICPLTGLIWAELDPCCEFMAWMATANKTGSQVCMHE